MYKQNHSFPIIEYSPDLLHYPFRDVLVYFNFGLLQNFQRTLTNLYSFPYVAGFSHVDWMLLQKSQHFRQSSTALRQLGLLAEQSENYFIAVIDIPLHSLFIAGFKHK